VIGTFTGVKGDSYRELKGTVTGVGYQQAKVNRDFGGTIFALSLF